MGVEINDWKSLELLHTTGFPAPSSNKGLAALSEWHLFFGERPPFPVLAQSLQNPYASRRHLAALRDSRMRCFIDFIDYRPSYQRCWWHC